MLSKLFVLTFLFPALVWGNCPYPQQNFPVEQQDEQHNIGVQVRELRTARTTLERQMPQINADIMRVRNSVHYYLRAPWGNAVIEHMDNGFDCCDSSQRTAKRDSAENNRRPAGTDIVDEPVSGGEIVDPMPYYDEPEPTAPAPEPSYSGNDSSCYGYSQEYCQPNWGRNESPSTGGLCLQTGFAATNAWYNASCRSGGRVNPGICGDARISKYPNDYEQCVQILNDYYRLSRAKRRMSGQLNAYNEQIKGLNQGRGRAFMAGVGNFLRAAGPFLLMAYIANKQSQSSVRDQYQSYRPPYSGSVGSIGQPNSLSGRYSSGVATPPAYYGSDYGHPFQSGGVMGQLLPALMTGGFGCSSSGGSGLESILPILMGGMSAYQPGGINGSLNGSIPGGSTSPDQGSGWIGPARPSTGNQRNYLGQERNAVFYDMLGGARQRIVNNQQESQQISNYLSGTGPFPTTGGVGTPTPIGTQQSTYAPGMESFGLIQSLLMGGSANATFNLQSVPPGF